MEWVTTGWVETSRKTRCPSATAAVTASAKRTGSRRFATQYAPSRGAVDRGSVSAVL